VYDGGEKKYHRTMRDMPPKKRILIVARERVEDWVDLESFSRERIIVGARGSNWRGKRGRVLKEWREREFGEDSSFAGMGAVRCGSR
jgi:hypothetical protein